MSENYSANPNELEPSADRPHATRYFVARGFVQPGETVVDAACAYGYGSAILAQTAAYVTAIDKLDIFLPQWKQSNIKPVVADLTDPSFEYPGCDVWVSLETIEHLADPQAYLDKVTVAAKRRIVISSPNKPTKDEHEFHLSDVTLVQLQKLMDKYPDWILYNELIQGMYYIAIYAKRGTKLLG